MTRTTSARRSALVVALLALPLATAGCGIDDVELNGGIFRAVGIGGEKVRAKEPQMTARAPLVVPPSLERLPEPGAPPQAVPADVASIQDEDEKKKVSRAELERQQAEYCKKNYELPKAHGDDTTADLAEGPLGPCRKSILTSVDVLTGGDEE